MIHRIKAIGEGICNILYPKSCPICGVALGEEEGFTCQDCRIKLVPISKPVCLKCGKEVENEEQDCCSDCQTMTRTFVKGFPAVHYNQAMSKVLSAFKYENMRCHGGFLADTIVRHRGKDILMARPEVIVPVPIHSSKLNVRGYNQALILGRELGRILGIPVDDGLVIRAAKTAPQKDLGNIEREENLKRAFISSKKIVQYKSALIVDDIYTTGATVEACTAVLHSMGIKDVYYTSVCIGKGL